MSSQQNKKWMMILLTTLFIISSFQFISSFEFEVGDNTGWIVPPANDTKFYNGWASEQRFKVDDTIRFKYKKDSVMEVNETEYKKCNTTHPYMFSNTGNSIIKLDRSGLFYFISGVFGHCEKGQKMIVKVLSQDQDSHSSTAATPPPPPPPKSSSSSSAFSLISHVQFFAFFLASYRLI